MHTWRHALRHTCRARGLHTSRPLFKNQYYYYDLGTRQPKARDVIAHKNGSRVFDPSINASAESMAERVQKVFGSLGSREESKKEAQAKGVRVLGVLVPARPEEPTNCCQSGCINCVWELYKDEIEEWKHARKEAQTLLMRPENANRPWPAALGPEPRNRQDAPVLEEDDGLDSGIAQFIEIERRLHARKKQRQERQQQTMKL